MMAVHRDAVAANTTRRKYTKRTHPVTTLAPDPAAQTVATYIAARMGEQFRQRFPLQTNADGSVTVLNPGAKPRHGR